MHERIQDAFGAVRADDALKEKTLAYLAQQRAARRPQPRVRHSFAPRRLAAALACLVLLCLGCGGWVYFTPTAAIQIDINPSLELRVNRFDRVLSVEAGNADGQQLADTLQLRFLSSDQAMAEILESETVSALLAQDGVLSVAVVSGNDGQQQRLCDVMAACTAQCRNAYCYAASPEEAEQARAAGLSCGKYRAYLALQELDPDITPDEVRGMSMRELLDRIAALSGDTSDLLGSMGGGQGQGGRYGAMNGGGQHHGWGGRS